MTSHKEQVLANLSLVKDEPAEELMFGFDTFAQQILDILADEKTVTPFVIAIHGEWGSGKTSLIKSIKKLLDEKIKDKDWKTLEFDAWEYERVDVTVALLQQIEHTYRNAGEKIRDFSNALGNFVLDAALRKIVGMNKRDAQSHFNKFIASISTIKTDLEKITKDGRLIVFVDDLDRCNIDNVLDMLEAIKMFLTARGVIFVIAVDMAKIERAWQLRYNNKEGLTEGRQHIDKIFQLKLSLPPKDDTEIEKLVSSMVPDDSLSKDERSLIINGCDPNPRKIKRLLNLVYFILKGLPDEEDKKFDEKVPLVIAWCILTTSFPELAKIIKIDPYSLIRMSFVCFQLGLFYLLNNTWEKMKSKKASSSVIQLGDLTASPSSFLTDSTTKGIQYIVENENEAAFRFLRIFAKYYKIKYDPGKDLHKTLSTFDSKIIPILREIINKGGMTGI